MIAASGLFYASRVSSSLISRTKYGSSFMTGPDNVKSHSDFQNLRLGGVPATDTGVIGNPSAISILQSQILESGFPAWFSTLAPDAQSWVLGIAMTAATIIPEIASLEVEAGLTTYTSSAATAPASTSASTTSHSSNTMVATTKATTTSQVITTTQTSSPASPSTSSSKAGAAPTKVIAGFLGAVGFLGLAVAL